MKGTLRERALAKVRIDLDGPALVDESPCWMWIAASGRDGYGHVWDGARVQLAHRVIYELLRAPIAPGLTLDHLCRVRLCVNPAHLEPVTSGENTRRGESFAAVNGAKTSCDKGHAFTLDNTYLYAGRPQKRRICRACDRDRHRLIRSAS